MVLLPQQCFPQDSWKIFLVSTFTTPCPPISNTSPSGNRFSCYSKDTEIWTTSIQTLQHLLQWYQGREQWKQSSKWKVDVVLTYLEGFVPQISVGRKTWLCFKLRTYLKEDALQYGFRDMNYYFSFHFHLKQQRICFALCIIEEKFYVLPIVLL